MTHSEEMATLAADIQATMAALPGPFAMADHLVQCAEADCPICRGCAALLSNSTRWVN